MGTSIMQGLKLVLLLLSVCVSQIAAKHYLIETKGGHGAGESDNSRQSFVSTDTALELKAPLESKVPGDDYLIAAPDPAGHEAETESKAEAKLQGDDYSAPPGLQAETEPKAEAKLQGDDYSAPPGLEAETESEADTKTSGMDYFGFI